VSGAGGPVRTHHELRSEAGREDCRRALRVNITPGTPVSEQYILDLEREGLMLCPCETVYEAVGSCRR
jgi:hypothetical protein